MSGDTGPITSEGKEISKQNAIKHGLYLNFSDFFPCNLCVNRNSCSDFEQGGICKIDQTQFEHLMKEDLDAIKTLQALIRLNTVRLNRATQQLNREPHNIELTRISAELRQEIQTLFIMQNKIKEVPAWKE